MTVDITSPSNERIRAAARLRNRDERDRTRLTIVDGVREIGRALNAGVTVDTSFVCESLLSADGVSLVERLRSAGGEIVRTSEIAFRKLAFGDRSEGVVAIVRQPAQSLSDLRLPADPLVVVLEAIEKPGNLGAVLRSADGAGVDALIVAAPRTDLFNPNTIRASIGTVFAVPIASAGAGDVREYLAEHAVRIVAARPDATTTYTEADLTGAVALLLGSEATGLTASWSGPGITAVRLPMAGIADSLNVSTAAAILLYEARRQRAS